MAPHNDHSKWIFGLSVDETISWAAAKINPDDGSFYNGVDDKFGGNIANTNDVGPINLQSYIERELKTLEVRYPFIFDECSAVGISSIGIVDTIKCRLVSIARKNWISDTDGYIVDFASIIPTFFTHKPLRIAAQNDATAKCLAEYYWFHQRYSDDKVNNKPPVNSLCYVLFHEGVNGGFVKGNPLKLGAPVAHLLHQELGHVFPPLHPRDVKLTRRSGFGSRITGCPLHHTCFEGIASGARIRRQWGRPLKELKDHPDNPWDIISYYIAHFCWNSVLAIPPQRIVIGGFVIFDELIPLIKKHFSDLNKGHGDRPYIRYDELLEDDFIGVAQIRTGEGRAGALELARREALGPRARVASVGNQINQI